MLPKDDVLQYKANDLKQDTNFKISLPPLVRGGLKKFEVKKQAKKDPFTEATELFDKGELSPDDWNEIETVIKQIDGDMSAKLSKVKDPFIKKIRTNLSDGQISESEANDRLNQYRLKRLNQKAGDVIAGLDDDDLIQQLDDLAILDEVDRENLNFILKIISSDLTVKEQLLGVASLISNRDVQVMLYILILEPTLFIKTLEGLSNAISKLVLKILIKTIKYIIKKLKSALSIW